jgi:hypothetical protein
VQAAVRHLKKMDERLSKRARCLSIADLFPKIVYGGTEVEGLPRLLDGAKDWTARTQTRPRLEPVAETEGAERATLLFASRSNAPPRRARP